MNLFDITEGNYHVLRTLTFPEFPESKIEFDTTVVAVGEAEWSTEITIAGTYDGPTDVVAVSDYQLTWATDGESILEAGRATLELLSGGSVLSMWSSIITPEQGIDNFPAAGEVIDILISPFQFEGNGMSYEWEGTVRVISEPSSGVQGLLVLLLLASAILLRGRWRGGASQLVRFSAGGLGNLGRRVRGWPGR